LNDECGTELCCSTKKVTSRRTSAIVFNSFRYNQLCFALRQKASTIELLKSTCTSAKIRVMSSDEIRPSTSRLMFSTPESTTDGLASEKPARPHDHEATPAVCAVRTPRRKGKAMAGWSRG
jgi:hypothetical protein